MGRACPPGPSAQCSGPEDPPTPVVRCLTCNHRLLGPEDRSQGESRKAAKTPLVTRTMVISSSRKRRFVVHLLRWYARHGRDLPWRRTRNPYHILVSEIMLQQTPVPRVIPKYREWLRRYPSLEVLARASVREVRETWYPLGYNIRPRRLRDIARTVLKRHQGRLPPTKDALLTLKGIGPYTAGAGLP